MNEKKLEYTIAGCQFELRDQVAKAVDLVHGVKGLIDTAVRASPEASMVWAGVCVILPLLTNPKTADEANRDGFSYVTTRMEYYIALEPVLSPLYESAGVSGNLVKAHVKDLYQEILNFQVRSVLRFFRSSFANFSRDVIRHDNWEEMLQRVKELERVVQSDISQVNDLKLRQELENLNHAADKQCVTMKQLLSVAEQQLKLTLDHRNIAQEGLQIQKDVHSQTLSDKENKCLQLFRLTRADKDVTYEGYKARVEDRVEGTCEWFQGHRNFQNWLQQDSGLLIVSADPGCGKSVLAKYLIDHKLSQVSTVCYFFFKDQDQNTVRQALCALLHQIFCHKHFLIHYAMKEYENNGEGLINATQTLWNIFQNAMRDPQTGPVTIVLDALDECKEQELRDLIDGLKSHAPGDTQSHRKIKYLLTSRPYEQITSQLQRLFGTFSTVHISGDENSDAIGEEVNHVIKGKVRELAGSKRLNKQTEDRLTYRLLDMKHRTYLWVYLIFDYLKGLNFKKTPKGIDDAIRELPKNVDEAYEDILDRSKDPEVARIIFSIILAAKRPLTIAEMNIAVNTKASMTSISDLDLEEDQDFELRMKSLCGLFVTTYHGQIHFLHQTAREFLMSESPPDSQDRSSPLKVDSYPQNSSWKHSITAQQAHAALAYACVTYLTFFNAEEFSTDEFGNTDLDVDVNPFLDYSAKHWGGHFREASISDDVLKNHTMKICRPESRSYSIWFRIFWKSRNPWRDNTFTSLLIASYFGHEEIVESLLEIDIANVDSKDNHGRTPLSWAAGNGHGTVVKLLLDTKQVDVDSKDNHGRTPLSWAARNGHGTVVKLLLDTKQVDVDSKNNFGYTPLSWAAEEGREAIVKLLLDTRQVDVDSKDNFGYTPLSLAAGEGREAIVKLLLDTKQVDVDSKDNFGYTPLSRAAGEGREAIVKLLLDTRQVDVNSKDDNGRTPLSWAAENGHGTVVKLLLDTKQVDVDSKDNFGYTPLSRAAGEGHEVIYQVTT